MAILRMERSYNTKEDASGMTMRELLVVSISNWHWEMGNGKWEMGIEK